MAVTPSTPPEPCGPNALTTRLATGPPHPPFPSTQLISSDEESVVDVAVATPAAPTNSEQRRGERKPALTSADTLPGFEKCLFHLTIGKNKELEREIEVAI
ncbi:hypothetical protein BC938DRAFT_477390 [Jimgerdemannia flammicorona]|uniref:Uncharacterized protein n=1 Tax=Jimgerdemannia flammicorona TaxID=994334 RepID=A0A433QPB8_9FUNG|nr:hypothetical protein BC938DRAFT_477390 [Jimgerdemannia flammicorona]